MSACSPKVHLNLLPPMELALERDWLVPSSLI